MPDSPPHHVHDESPQFLIDNGPWTPDASQESKNCRCKNPGRNLVVCIDGTSNKFGTKNTNVTELYNRIIKSHRQLTYYNSGIGTYPKPRRKLSWTYIKQRCSRIVDLAIAINFDKIVLAAYRWLSEHYEENDRIYMFGFSRGAYQVRTIAAMINKVGLLHRGNLEQIPFAYEFYLDPESSRVQTWNAVPESVNKSVADSFKGAFSRENVHVHFVGVWDTVSSIGIARGKELPNVDEVEDICVFRHALALDECRVKFLPEYVHGGEGPTEEEEKSLHVKEVWFPGTHSDVGGGNRENPHLNLGGLSLQWMSYESIAAGLSLNVKDLKLNWEKSDGVTESLRGGWKLFEMLPIKRLSYKDQPLTTRWPPHRGEGRTIQPNQKIHVSVAFCKPDEQTSELGTHKTDGKPYRPKAKSDIYRDFLESVDSLRDNMVWAIEPIIEQDITAARLKRLALAENGLATLLTMKTAIPLISLWLRSPDLQVRRHTIEAVDKLLEDAATASILFAQKLFTTLDSNHQMADLKADGNPQTAFLAATYLDEDCELARISKNEGFDLKITHKLLGVTALLLAVERGSCKAIQELLKHGVDINATGGGGAALPALHRAVRAGHADVVELLLENDATVDLKDMEGKTAWEYLLKGQDIGLNIPSHTDIQDAMGPREKGTVYTSTRIQHHPFEAQFTETLTVEKQVNVTPENVDVTKVREVVKSQQALEVQLLTDVKAISKEEVDVNLQEGDPRVLRGLEVQEISVAQGQQKVLEEVREEVKEVTNDKDVRSDQNMDVQRHTDVQETLRAKEQVDFETEKKPENIEATATISKHLPKAGVQSKRDISKLLRKAGANPNAKQREGVNPLHSAAAGGHLEEVKFLLDNDTDPSIFTDYGWTPLHWAAANGHKDVVELLLNRGVDPFPRSATGETPLDKAQELGRTEIVKLLKERKVKQPQRGG